MRPLSLSRVLWFRKTGVLTSCLLRILPRVIHKSLVGAAEAWVAAAGIQVEEALVWAAAEALEGRAAAERLEARLVEEREVRPARQGAGVALPGP